jgi:hypothetical protein
MIEHDFLDVCPVIFNFKRVHLTGSTMNQKTKCGGVLNASKFNAALAHQGDNNESV